MKSALGNEMACASIQTSGFVLILVASCFFSDSWPRLTMWQRLQGCLPSKVLDTATEIGASFE